MGTIDKVKHVTAAGKGVRLAYATVLKAAFVGVVSAAEANVGCGGGGAG